MAFTKISVFFCLIIGMTLEIAHATKDLQVCAEPFDLQDQWNSLYTNQVMGQMDESFYMLPFLSEAATNHTRRYNFREEHMKREAVLNGSSTCPNKHSHDYLRDGDPCPVYYTLNTDPHRYPHVLMEAQCKCGRHCQGIPVRITIRKPHHKAADYLSKCQGTFRIVKVLRRLPECVDGVYQYVQAWQKLQTGCNCHLKRVN